MKKTLRISLCLLMIAVLLVSAFTISISAASATTHFSPSKSEYAIGEQITVTIKVNVGEETYSIDGSLSYDNSIVQYVSGGANQGSSVKIAESFSGEKEVSVSVVFKTIAEGKCNFAFSGFCTDGNLKPHNVTTGYFINSKNPTPPTSSSTPSTPSTPPTPTPSTNANLASLKVSGATLSPKFNSNTTNYTASVPFATEKVTISAGAADGGATFTGAGTINLKVGENKRTITVTAASGAKKSYNIVITRLAEDQGEPEPPVENVDPLLISAEGVSRKIMQDISSMPVPESFSATTAEVNGVQVGALTEIGGRYTLYYTTLEDGSDAALYYKDDIGEFRRLLYIEVGGKFYIIADSPEGSAPNGWYRDVMNVTAGSVTAYRSEDSALKDFYVLYCYADGTYGFYRFDSLKTTIQRAPDFNLGAFVSNDEVILPDEDNIFEKFGKMNPTGKVIIVLIIIAVICIIGLVVLLVLRLTGAARREDDEDGLFMTDDEYSENTANFDFMVDNTNDTEEATENE